MLGTVADTLFVCFATGAVKLELVEETAARGEGSAARDLPRGSEPPSPRGTMVNSDTFG